MGYARYFYAETLNDSRRTSLHPNTSEPSSDGPAQHIAWISEKLGRSWVAELFSSRDWGPHSGLLAMRSGLPPDARRSAICNEQGLLHLSDLDELHPSVIEADPHWSWATDLMIPEWPQTTLLVTAMAPAGLAEMFGDGRGAHPLEYDSRLQELLHRPEYRAMAHTFLRHCQGCTTAIDQRHGAVAHHRRSVPPHCPVPVTWSVSLTDVLGPTFCAAFQALLRLPDLDEVRIIAYRR